MSAVAPDRDFIVTGARLSAFNHSRDSRANTNFLVKSLVKKYKADGCTLLQAAEWAESIVLSNVEWLVKLAKRGDSVDETSPVVLSVGNGHEIMVVWASSPLPPGNLSIPVRRVNVALTLCSDDAAQTMNGATLVQTYGCIQPCDSLYEHVRCEVDLSDARPTIYLSTEHVPWAGSPSIVGMGTVENEKRRVLVVQTSPQDPFTPLRVESVADGASYFARIAADGNSPRSANSLNIVAQASQAARTDGGKEADGMVEGTGFRPRELLMLARAYQSEPYSEQEMTWDVTQATQQDIQQCERVLGRQVSLVPLEQSNERNAKGTVVKPKKGSSEQGLDQSKASKDMIASDANPEHKKKRGRPVGSKNKPKDPITIISKDQKAAETGKQKTTGVANAESAAAAVSISGTVSSPPPSKGSAMIQGEEIPKKTGQAIVPQQESQKTPQVGALKQSRDDKKMIGKKQTNETKAPEVLKQPGTPPRPPKTSVETPKKSEEIPKKKQAADAKSPHSDEVVPKRPFHQAGPGGSEGTRKRGRPKGSKNRSKEDKKKRSQLM